MASAPSLSADTGGRPPGAGKSVPVERFQRDLPDALWSWGACDGLSTPRPLAPLFDLAHDLGGALEDLRRGRPERDELFAALLKQVAGNDRLDVIVIEDIHWADEATLDLMRFLTRRIRAASVPVRTAAAFGRGRPHVVHLAKDSRSPRLCWPSSASTTARRPPS